MRPGGGTSHLVSATTRLAIIAAVSGLARGSSHQAAFGSPSAPLQPCSLARQNRPPTLAAALAGPSLGGGGVGLRMSSGGAGGMGIEGEMGNGLSLAGGREMDVLRDKGFRRGDKVILYDGVCNMCNGWVTYVLKNNKKGDFKFAALQGDSGRALLTSMGRNPDDLSTLVLLDGDETVYTKSEAVLRVLASCGGITGRAATLVRKLVPRRFRDYIYSDIVAPNRYKFFGKVKSGESCRRITGRERVRFLD